MGRHSPRGARHLGAFGLAVLAACALALAGCGDGAVLTHTAPPGPDSGGAWNAGGDGGGQAGTFHPVGPIDRPLAPPSAGGGTGGTGTGGDTGGGDPAGHGPPYPIVLVHGMGGFDTLRHLGLGYFNGVRTTSSPTGSRTCSSPRPRPTTPARCGRRSSRPRSPTILAKTGAAKVDLVAHSQGGLDARILASPGGLGEASEIASITMIGTPNRGTPVADLVMTALRSPFGGILDRLTDAVLMLLERSVYDLKTDPRLRAQVAELTTRHMTKVFNAEYPDAPGVAYMSYAGRTNFETGIGACAGSFYPNEPTQLDAAQVPLFPTALYLQGLTGRANDGMVPVSSARWGTFLRCIPADHGREVGQIDLTGPDPLTGFDHLAFYRRVVSRLRAMGF